MDAASNESDHAMGNNKWSCGLETAIATPPCRQKYQCVGTSTMTALASDGVVVAPHSYYILAQRLARI